MTTARPGGSRPTSRARMILIELGSAEAVQAQWQHLAHGGALGPPGGKPDTTVSLMIVGPLASPIELPARTVYCGADGTGYELLGFGPELKRRLEAWVAENSAPDAADHARTTKMPTLRRPRAPAPAPVEPPPVAVDEDAGDAAEDTRIPRNVAERVRALTAVQQLKLARDGELSERVALERLLGKAVWEALLRNPRITPPEVARIARMGTAPAPLLEQICATAAWLRAPEVRRALLANPRLSSEQIARVLKLLPKHELRLVPVQSAYPPAVRDAARRLLPKV